MRERVLQLKEEIAGLTAQEQAKDKEVALVGFGTFAIATRPARRGFNPHTKQPMKIRAMKTIRFKAGAALRGLV